MSVSVKLGFKKSLRDVVSSNTSKKKVAELIISEMKDHIARGISPVRGQRRFVAYKDPPKYPGDAKTRRPVNLELSGDMLKALKFYPLKATSFSIAIKGKEGIIAKAHNDGKGNVPMRRFMPTKSGEEYTVTITRKIRDLYARLISDIIKRSRSR